MGLIFVSFYCAIYHRPIFFIPVSVVKNSFNLTFYSVCIVTGICVPLMSVHEERPFAFLHRSHYEFQVQVFLRMVFHESTRLLPLIFHRIYVGPPFFIPTNQRLSVMQKTNTIRTDFKNQA